MEEDPGSKVPLIGVLLVIVVITLIVSAIGYVGMSSITTEPTPTPVPSPTIEPTIEPTPTPAPTPTPVPSPSPSPAPSPTVIVVFNDGLPHYGPGHNEPTTPTTQPTAQPTQQPTPSPVPTPTPTPMPVAWLSVASWTLDPGPRGDYSYITGDTISGNAVVVNNGNAAGSGTLVFIAYANGMQITKNTVDGFTLSSGSSSTCPYSITVLNGMTYNGEMVIVASFNSVEIGRYNVNIKINP